MMKVLKMAVYGKDNEEIARYVKNEVLKIRKGIYPVEELGFSKGISKNLGDYGNQDWIRAARWTNIHSGLWNSQTDYGAGSKPKFVYVKPSLLPEGYQKIELIALDDNFNLPERLINAIDFDVLIDKTVGNKIEMILDALGLKWSNLSSLHKTNSLTKY